MINPIRTCGTKNVFVISAFIAFFLAHIFFTHLFIYPQIFDDAYRSELSCIFLNDLEQLMGYSPIGPRYQSLVLDAMYSLLSSSPPKVRSIACTTSLSYWTPCIPCSHPRLPRSGQLPALPVSRTGRHVFPALILASQGQVNCQLHHLE